MIKKNIFPFKKKALLKEIKKISKIHGQIVFPVISPHIPAFFLKYLFHNRSSSAMSL
jgi:hypothetical protein